MNTIQIQRVLGVGFRKPIVNSIHAKGVPGTRYVLLIVDDKIVWVLVGAY